MSANVIDKYVSMALLHDKRYTEEQGGQEHGMNCQCDHYQSCPQCAQFSCHNSLMTLIPVDRSASLLHIYEIQYG